MITKRFVVFGGSRYYPLGGFLDYLDSFNTKNEALQFIGKWLKDQEDHCWGQVADMETGDFWCEKGLFNMTRLLRKEPT